MNENNVLTPGKEVFDNKNQVFECCNYDDKDWIEDHFAQCFEDQLFVIKSWEKDEEGVVHEELVITAAATPTELWDQCSLTHFKQVEVVGRIPSSIEPKKLKNWICEFAKLEQKPYTTAQALELCRKRADMVDL